MAWIAQPYVGKMPTFMALPPPQIYYAPPVQPVQSLSLTPPVSLGQVFAQQNHPNQPTPNNQQGQASLDGFTVQAPVPMEWEEWGRGLELVSLLVHSIFVEVVVPQMWEFSQHTVALAKPWPQPAAVA